MCINLVSADKGNEDKQWVMLSREMKGSFVQVILIIIKAQGKYKN